MPIFCRHFFLAGIEGSFWGETVRTADQVHSMLFPRLLALAERAWHKASWESIPKGDIQDRERSSDWVKFANTMAHKELGRLDKMGVAYHVPTPGARLVFNRNMRSTLKVSYTNF